MLLIIASAFDGQALGLAERWIGRDVGVVTPRDLSRPGWRLRLGRPGQARAAIGDRLVPADEIEAVVSLLPWVGPYELTHLVRADRTYVAAEMTAFLLAFLHELRCPVVDRPSPSSLTGCGRWPGEWASIAADAGIDADIQRRGSTTDVTVVGGRVVDEGIASCLVKAGETLAAAGGRSLITLQFAAGDRHAVLVGAMPRADVSSHAVSEALSAWLRLS